jgi:N utilization substance protein B
MLFQLDLSGGSPAGVIAQFWSGTPGDDRERPFASRLVRGVAGRQDELDRWIVASAENWRLERMAVVDRNVLRLAVFEMLEDPQTPAAVVIDEAVEIAKKFGSSASGSFINGVLDSIRRRIAGGTERDDGSGSSGSAR